jgi:hypothetical protein
MDCFSIRDPALLILRYGSVLAIQAFLFSALFLSPARLEGMWTEAFDMPSAIFQ